MTADSNHPDSLREPVIPDFSESRSLLLDSERFRLLVENSRDLIVEVSHLGDILYVTSNVRAVLGYSPDELLGRSAFARVHPDDLHHVQEQLATRTGRATGRHQHRDGSWRWLETSGRDFITPCGAGHRVLIVRDITAQMVAGAERERLEIELARTKKLVALGALAGGIAHDFNNLLTGINAYAHLAQVESCQPEVIDLLAELLKATDRAKHLAQGILGFWHQQKHACGPVLFAPIVREVLALMRPTIRPGIDVVTDLREETGWVLADETQMFQVVLNLCGNALHAMEARPGRLEVRLTHVIANDAALASDHARLRPGSYVCLEVIDTGHGMDTATQRRIFEPFFTTKKPRDGTGVGLAVVQRIIREHDGTIHVTSRPGEGTAFRILLPKCSPPSAFQELNESPNPRN